MGRDKWLRYLTSALIQVASGITEPDKVIAWMKMNDPPYDLCHTASVIKWWLESADRKQISKAQLQHNLGYWLMGHLDYADAMNLEFIKGIYDGSRRDSSGPS